jgi:hypothetical protein
MGETNSTERMNAMVFSMIRCECVLLKVAKNTLQGIVMCAEELHSFVLRSEEHCDTDRLWCHEEQFKSFDFSSRRCQRSMGEDRLAIKEAAKTSPVDFFSLEKGGRCRTTPRPLLQVEVLEFDTLVVQVVAGINRPHRSEDEHNTRLRRRIAARYSP